MTDFFKNDHDLSDLNVSTLVSDSELGEELEVVLPRFKATLAKLVSQAAVEPSCVTCSTYDFTKLSKLQFGGFGQFSHDSVT